MAKEFIISESNKQYAKAEIDRLDCLNSRYVMTILPYKAKRSLQQNRWIRKYAAEFGKHFGYDADFAYQMLMFKFNPAFKTDLDGNEIRMAGSFSKLNTKEAAEVQEAVIRYGDEHGFYFGLDDE